MTLRKRIVVFSSHGPGNLRTVLDLCRARSIDDFRVVYLVADRAGIPSIELAESYDIPWRVYPFPPSDIRSATFMQMRWDVCDRILSDLIQIERAEGIDLVVSAFRRILVGPLVSHFEGRFINVHPADLSIVDDDGHMRRYVGIGGLRRSLDDGNLATRTTVHYLDSGVDTGKIICQGPWVPVDRSGPVDIHAHESKQKILSDAPALRAALEYLLLHCPIPPEMIPPMLNQLEYFHGRNCAI